MWSRIQHIVYDQRGSMAPLGIGLFFFSLVFGITAVSATSMFVFQKRLTTLAESTALFVAAGTGDAASFLATIGGTKLEGAVLDTSIDADQRTVVAKVCATWRAPVVTLSSFAKTQICSHASARAGN